MRETILAAAMLVLCAGCMKGDYRYWKGDGQRRRAWCEVKKTCKVVMSLNCPGWKPIRWESHLQDVATTTHRGAVVGRSYFGSSRTSFGQQRTWTLWARCPKDDQ